MLCESWASDFKKKLSDLVKVEESAKCVYSLANYSNEVYNSLYIN